jgi:hypothetical protein
MPCFMNIYYKLLVLATRTVCRRRPRLCSEELELISLFVSTGFQNNILKITTKQYFENALCNNDALFTICVNTRQRHRGRLAKQKLHWFCISSTLVQDTPTTALQDTFINSELTSFRELKT